MSKRLLTTVICMACALLAVADATDAQLREILHRAVCYIDDPYGGPGEVRYAIRLSGDNTNRVVSLMKQMIDEGNKWDGIKKFYISEIGKHGTPADLPFLYQRVATTNLCRSATEAILRIEGLTTNSVACIMSQLPNVKSNLWETMSARCLLLDEAKKHPSGDLAKTLLISNAVLYASRLTSYVNIFDKCLRDADPTYATSKRRLSVLRSVRALGANKWQTNFVERTIRELEAYPEANLPE